MTGLGEFWPRGEWGSCGPGLETPFADFAVEVGLEVAAGLDMKSSEPSAAADVGIDADGVTEIERLMGFLGGVATNHGLPGAVRAGWSVKRMIELLMDQGVGNLLVDGDFGFEVGVDENMALGLDEGLVAKEEGPVFFGDVVHAIGAIGIEGLLSSPDRYPVIEVGSVDTGENEFLFVVAAKEVDLEVLVLLDEKVDHFFGMSSPVHVVAHEDDVVFRLRVERLPKGEERFEAAVNVTDSKCSHKKNLLAQSERL